MAEEVPLKASFPCLRNAYHLAFDLKTSVATVAYAYFFSRTMTQNDGTVKRQPFRWTRIRFEQIHSDRLSDCLSTISKECDLSRIRSASCTGSLADQYKSRIESNVGRELIKPDVTDCLVRGTNFLLTNILDEAFTYDHHSKICKYSFNTVVDKKHLYPYLLVSIGIGTSIHKVTGDAEYERIGGSSQGAGCFLGMGSLLVGKYDLDKLLQMAHDGTHKTLDTLVSDLYDAKTASTGLPHDVIAASFGKCGSADYAEKVREDANYRADILRSLLLMISNSVGQVAVLYAQQACISRIYFCGSFVKGHPIVTRTLSYAVNFWSKGSMQAQFLRHGRFVIAAGALLQAVEKLDVDEKIATFDKSWREHYVADAALDQFVPTAPVNSDGAFKWNGLLEMECCEMTLSVFPLLRNDVPYSPDTIDLNRDAEARDFWLKCMADSVTKTVAKAVESQSACHDARDRAEKVKQKYLKLINILTATSFAYGCCSVRNLLDLREHILNEYNFDDAYLKQKTLENEVAIVEYDNVISHLDSIQDDIERQTEAVKGMLAGNVFDWGAKEVIRMMERREGLSFRKAVSSIEERPWLVDDLDLWLAYYRKKKYRSAVIFVDNSGADAILGVLPFARELLKRGTRIILACNSSPALNDITYIEMKSCLRLVGPIDSVLGPACTHGEIEVFSNGQSSPCLDLRRVCSDLCDAIQTRNVDLVVIEGMGRAIHTNYEAQFSCDTMKLAVIKTKWLADRLGGHLFSVVCSFKPQQST